jgi:hypothetical protein
MLKYVVGDATNPQGAGPKILVHLCNDAGHWGAGFVLAVSRRWPAPERHYHLWHRAGELEGLPFALGQVQFVAVAEALWVANLIGQQGIRRRGPPARRPSAMKLCGWVWAQCGNAPWRSRLVCICRVSARVWRAGSGILSRPSSKQS